MTQSPQPGNGQEPASRRIWLLLLGRTSLAVGVILLLGLAGGAWWAWNFINEDLAPLVEKNLRQLLGRPVEVGDVESFSLTSLRFGSLTIPATPQDPDRLKAEAVEVGFSPLSLLFNRTLELNVTLVDPNIYLEQDKQGRWITTELQQVEGAGFIRTDLQAIRIRNADVALNPNPRPGIPKGGVVLDNVSGVARLREEAIRYELSGVLARGGKVALTGITQLPVGQTTLAVKGDDVLAADVSRLVDLPVRLLAGRVDGDLKVQLQPMKGQEEAQISVFGRASLQDVTAQVENLPQPFRNAMGQLVFAGQEVTLQSVNARYGSIPLVANGSIGVEKGYNLAARVKSASVQDLLKTLNAQLPVQAAGQLQAQLQVKGPIQTPLVTGTASSVKPLVVDRLRLKDAKTSFRLQTAKAGSKLTFANIQVSPAVGGQLLGKGEVVLDGKEQPQVMFDLLGRNLPGDALAKLYGFATPITIGDVAAKATVTGSVGGTQPLQINLISARATPAGGGEIVARGQVGLAPQGQVNLNIQAQNIPGDAIAKAYGVATPIQIGGVSANATVTGTLGGEQPLQVNLTSVQATPPVGGQVTVSGQVGLAPQGQVRLDVQAQNLPGDAIAKAYDFAAPVKLGNLSANATIIGRLPQEGGKGLNLEFRDAVLRAAGGAVRARGEVAQGRWQAFVDTQGIELSRFPGLPTPAQQGVLSAQLQLAGSTETFQPETIQATGQATIANIAGGRINLENIRLRGGRWQTLADISQVQLGQLAEELRGRLNGNVQIAGTTASLQLEDIRAAGRLRFSQGLAVIEEPLTAQVRWNGDQIIVQQATAPGLSAQGTIDIQLPETGGFEIADLNLNVQARGYNLADFNLLPAPSLLMGQLDFTGRVTGTPTAPSVVGDVRLRDLRVSDVAFDPVLTGNVNLQPGQRTQLQLSGVQDQIAVTLGPNNRPVAFTIRLDDAIATGRTEGDILNVDLQNLPIALLQNLLPAPTPTVSLAGDLSGDFAVNLEEMTAVGDVVVQQPRLGRLTAEQFQAQIIYSDGTARLQAGQLQFGDGNINLSGSLQTEGNRQYQLQIGLDQIRIQRLLPGVSVFELPDIATGLEPPKFAGAEALQTTPVGLPRANLITQVRRFSEIEALVQQQVQQQEAAATFPTLADLTGTITGQVVVSGSLQPGIQPDFSAQFDLRGTDWQWGRYDIQRVIAEGSFNNGVLTLLPLRVELPEGLLAFTGQLGSEELSGQLRIASLPVSLLQPILQDLPINVTGQLNAIATLAGSLTDPRVIGEVRLVNATLNQQPVQSAQLSFAYNDARLNFGSTVLVAGPEPVLITGSIPVALPNVAQQPDSNQISIQANVRDEGLALLNLLTDQVTWVTGQGQVNVEVAGTLEQPTIMGTATVSDATFRAQALPEPLTNVTGTLEFNGDRILVQTLQGQYNEGAVTAQGVLPIFATAQAQQQAAANPLNVVFNDLDVDLQNLYQGGVSGNIVVLGTALDPGLGGRVTLSNGEILLGNLVTGGANVTTSKVSAAPGVTATTNPLEFEDLQLILGNGVRVTLQPILSFVADGDINIDGNLANPLPQGVIRLTQGQVNLFTTQFTLARGYEQTARFTPDRGLDPILDVRLVSFVPETTGTPVATPITPFAGAAANEIADAPSPSEIGTLRTVRVQAIIEGPASQLAENLELTSDPARSEEEILALIGGTFTNVFGQENAVLGVATLAGTTLVPGLQSTISRFGQAVGFSEFRLFPTLITDPEDDVSVLGLAAEGVFDITENTSVSLSRVFAADETVRFNLLYRLSDEILVRGSTDFGEGRVLVEYETRF